MTDENAQADLATQSDAFISQFYSTRLNLMTETELAKALQLEVNTLRVWRREEKGPPYAKIGRTTFYRLDDVEAWLAFSVRVPTGTAMPHPYLSHKTARISPTTAIATASGVVGVAS